MTTPHNVRLAILMADSVWSFAAICAAYQLRYGLGWAALQSNWLESVALPLLLTLGLWTLGFSWLRLDGFRGGWRLPAVLSHLLLAIVGLIVILLAVGYLTRVYVSRLTIAYYGVLLFLGFSVIRVISRSALSLTYHLGAIQKTVIIGTGPLAHEMAAKISRHPEFLCQVVGFLCPAEEDVDVPSSAAKTEISTIQTLGIVDLLRAVGATRVILTVPNPSHPEILDLSARCRRNGIAVSTVPQPYELYLSEPKLRDLDGLPLLESREASIVSAYPVWKRMFDLAVSILSAPLLLVLISIPATILKLKKGSAFCRERRCGQHGQPFWMYRLASERGAVGLPGYERFLQRLSVTELPQFLNVLRGEMSLVGPRPEGLERARQYTDWHRTRLSVKPGMTGLAQVHGLRDQSSSEAKACYDLQYIKQRSLFQDISLLLQTGWTLLTRSISSERTPGAPDNSLAQENA